MKVSVVFYKFDCDVNGLYSVKLIVTHNGTTIRKTIGKSLVSDWNQAKNIPHTSHPNYVEFYSRVLNIKTRSGKYEFLEIIDVYQASSEYNPLSCTEKKIG